MRSFLALAIVIAAAAYAAEPQLDPYNPPYAPGRVLVKFKDNVEISSKSAGRTGIESIDRLNARYGVKSLAKLFPNAVRHEEKRTFKDPSGKVHTIPNLHNIYKLEIDRSYDPREVAREYEKDPNVEYAEPDYYYFAMATPGDPLVSDQWYLGAYPGVNAYAAWDSTTGDTTQVIGILDTGVDLDHPDLINKIKINTVEYNGVEGVDDDGNGYVDDIYGWDFINNDGEPDDDNSHGTHVAGISAAETDNATGIAGIAWNAKILPLKVLQSTGYGNSSDIAQAVTYAVENGATILNLSLGSYGESYVLRDALINAYTTAVIVAAAGNDGYKVDPPFPPYPIYKPMYPACYPWVLGVEASNQAGELANFSNFDPSGPFVPANPFGHNYEVRAPGVNIWSTFPDGSYHSLNGTSMATPIVSGAVALLKSLHPTWSNEEVFSKIINSTTGGILNLAKVVSNTQLPPDLYFLSYTIVDTLTGCDMDSTADAGETLQVYITVKNVGGYADSVWAELEFDEFEDTTAAEIIKDSSYIGDISTYATLTGEYNPFLVYFPEDLVNNRQIKFRTIMHSGSVTDTGAFTVTVQNGMEICGVYEGTLHLTADKFYLVTCNTVIETLIIDPGTVIHLNPDVTLGILDSLSAVGTPDSMIVFTVNGVGYWNSIKNMGADSMNFRYCIFEYGQGYNYGGESILEDATKVEDCIFRYNRERLFHYSNTALYRNVFYDNSGYIASCLKGPFEYNVVVNDSTHSSEWAAVAVRDPEFLPDFRYNAIFNNWAYNFTAFCYPVIDIFHLPPNYWGTTDSAAIENSIYDYFENQSRPILIGYDSAMVTPPTEVHGFVWKVEINDQNPQETDIVLGVGTAKFTVYFNRPMDISCDPLVTFGVREPYTQHVVVDSASWSADSTVWTAYYDITQETGDGINTVRVAMARDNEGFPIPAEHKRFHFTIQAAGSQAATFTATPGIGKVVLEWEGAQTSDALGYNLYRFHQIDDSTYSDTTRINNELITDTTYTDYNVVPDTIYFYMYTIVGTDLTEGDFSKVVQATPLSSIPGDANGDQVVDILDVIVIVNYILGYDPEPFIFDAADANGDSQVDVLDVITVVNYIFRGGTLAALPGGNTKISRAEISLSGNTLTLNSQVPVAGLQFTLVGRNMEKVQLMPLSKGFECAYSVRGDTLIGLLYSMSGRTLPEGEHDIMILKPAAGDISIAKVLAGDGSGNPIDVRIKSGAKTIPEKFALFQNRPNPFSSTTFIRYDLPRRAEIELSIYDLAGRKLVTLDRGAREPGRYSIRWNGRDEKGHRLPAGVYFCDFRAEAEGQTIARFTRKIILVR